MGIYKIFIPFIDFVYLHTSYEEDRTCFWVDGYN